MRIILYGTSSSGKSSIMNKFPSSYKKTGWDIYYEDIYQLRTYKPFESSMKNSYITANDTNKLEMLWRYKYYKKKTGGSKNYLIDEVSLDFYNAAKANKTTKVDKDVIIVLVYTDLQDLVRNIVKRKSYDPRGKFVFDQFAELYVKAKNKNEAIGTVKVGDFIKYLKKIKYEFKDEESLIKFAKKIFAKLGIRDTKKYYIMPRKKDHTVVMITKGKTATELKNMLLRMNK